MESRPEPCFNDDVMLSGLQSHAVLPVFHGRDSGGKKNFFNWQSATKKPKQTRLVPATLKAD